MTFRYARVSFAVGTNSEPQKGLACWLERMPCLFSRRRTGRGKKGGTESYPSIEAMGCAMKGVEGTLAQLPQRAHWRDSFETALKSVLPQVRILGL